MARYFVKNEETPRWDALYHTYYVYDDLNDRLYYAADNINRKEILNPKKSEILSSKKDFKKVEGIECFKPDFYVHVNRFRVYSRCEENTQYVDFLDEKSYQAFLKAMESLSSVKDFVIDGVKKLGVDAAKYTIKKSGYEAVFFEALRENAKDFVGSYMSPLSIEEDIKLSFAIDVENFVKDRFFLDVCPKFEIWLCHTVPEVIDLVEKNNEDEVTYFRFRAFSKDGDDGLYHIYYIYDKLKDELYYKVYLNCHKVTGVQRANIFKRKKEWLKLTKEECDNPDAYKKAVSYFFYVKNENDFLEFYEKTERDEFASILKSWESFEAFLKEAIEEMGKDHAFEVYMKSGSTSLLFSLLRQAYKHFHSYLSVDENQPEKEDFLSRSLRVLTYSLSNGDDSGFIADTERIFNDIFKKYKKSKAIKGSRVLLASKKVDNKEDKYWKIYTKDNEDEFRHDTETLKSMGYELIESLSVVDKSKCEDPEFYRRMRRFPVNASIKREDVFLEFSDIDGANKFDESFKSLSLLKDFLEEKIKCFGVSVAHRMATSPLLFALMYESAREFYWYIPKEKIYNEDDLHSDFADNTIKFLMARFSLDIEDFVEIFRGIFSKLREEEENEHKVSE